MTVLSREVAKRVLDTVDAGLVHGMGEAVPGKMCVEAAVCYALGLPHGDHPTCVGSAVRAYKIRINDARWSSDVARAKGLRRVAIAQLGSDTLDQREVADRLVIATVRDVLPPLLRRYGYEAVACEGVTTREAAKLAAQEAQVALCAAADAADAADATAAADATYAAYATAYAATADADAAAAAAAAYAAYATARDEVLTQAANRLERVLVEMGSPGAAWLDLTEGDA